MNIGEVRAFNALFNLTTTPFNARSSRFQGVPPKSRLGYN